MVWWRRLPVSLRNSVVVPSRSGRAGAAMARISDPQDIQDARLRAFSATAAWIAMVAESAEELEYLLDDEPENERLLPQDGAPWPWETDPMAVALHLTQTYH